MRNFVKFFGIVALVAAIGFSIIACGDGGGSSKPTTTTTGSGTFTVTDIPSTYNGKYAIFTAENNDLNLIGCETFNMQEDVVTLTLSLISDGSVSIPVWNGETMKRYSGNASFIDGYSSVAILNDKTLTINYEDEEEAWDNISILTGCYFENVIFANGSATVSWNDGEEEEE